MAPKRKKAGKAKSSKAKSSKAKRSSKAGKAAKAKKPKRAKSAYMFFCADQRAEVLRSSGMQDNKEAFGQAAKLLGDAWLALSETAKEDYGAWASLDKHRVTVDSLSVRAASDAPSAGKVLGVAVASVGKAPARARVVVDGVVGALEATTGRMPATLRADVGRYLGIGADEGMLGTLRGNLGMEVGNRIAALLQQWGRPTAARACRAGSLAPPLQAAPGQPSSSSTANAEAPIMSEADDIRNKVVGMLMRSVSKTAGKAHFQTCRQIEGALHELWSKDPKEYKQRARSLAFNLGAADGALLRRVVDGEVSSSELVRLDAEELASDNLKTKRKEERDRYFREQVHDTHGPPKKRRDRNNDVMGARRGEASGLPDEPAESQPAESQPLASQEAAEPEESSSAGGAYASSLFVGSTAAAPARRGARAGASAQPDSSSDDSSSEDSSSSSSGTSESLHAAPSALPIAASITQQQQDAEMARALAAASPSPSSPQSPSSPSQSPAGEPAPDDSRQLAAPRMETDATADDAELARALDVASSSTASSPSDSPPASPRGPGTAASSASQQPGSSAISPGKRVRLHGLNAAHLNGQHGTVTDWDPSEDRWRVRMDDGTGKALKEANLEVLGEAQLSSMVDLEAAKAQLLSMGFDGRGAEAALANAEGNLESAVAMLCGSQQ